MRKKKTEMLQGMLDLLILRTLRQGPLNGRDIEEWETWKRFSGGVELILRDA